MATPNKGLTQPANGSDVDTWDVPVNTNSNIIDNAFGGLTTINVVGASGTVALTSTQYVPPHIEFTGTLTANVNYQLPSGVGGVWIVGNGTTGAFSVTLSSAGGGVSVVLPQTYRIQLYSDGTNVALSTTLPPNITSGAVIAALGYTPANGLQSNGQQLISSGVTLGSSQAGANLLVSTAGITITFPSTAVTYWLSNVSAGSVTLSFPVGTDFRTTLLSGEKVGLAGDGAGFWRVVAAGFITGSPLAGTTLAASSNATIGGTLNVTGISTFSQGIFTLPSIFQTVTGYNYGVRIQAIASGSAILQFTDSTGAQWATFLSTGNGNLTVNASLQKASSGAYPFFGSGTNSSGVITVSSSAPSGTPGAGDIWLQHS